jgi:hypothetical protein
VQNLFFPTRHIDPDLLATRANGSAEGYTESFSIWRPDMGTRFWICVVAVLLSASFPMAAR